jgi:hydrogenase maturation protein HypF
MKDNGHRSDLASIGRLKVTIRGAVQGVGFRPFVYRLATELGLCGWVENSSQGVFIDAEGDRGVLLEFRDRLRTDRPPRSFIQSIESAHLDPVGYRNFEVRESIEAGPKTALVMPDIATCPDCLAEINDLGNRRYRYPFTNCTNCGPRFTIIETLPYDRANTTMKKFPMCDDCRREYTDPANRRFHAQPNACPVCGPHITLWDGAGKVMGERDEALITACAAIADGQIVAVKGLGGFHLIVDGRHDDAVRRLRRLKAREEKPLAIMAPSLEWAEKLCHLHPVERMLLNSPECPIVLIPKTPAGGEIIAELVAPNNPYLGVMLPYTPLHHLIMRQLGFPIVATSGNRSDEPICIDEREALSRLAGIADLFLVHDRPIARHVDDSVVRVMAGREMVVRRARGYAPLPVIVAEKSPPVLAVGAHLKNTIAIAVENQVIASQHIGDLETSQAYEAFADAITSLGGIYEFKPEMVACDMHPDYLSTKFAEKMAIPLVKVQHHYAHVLSCMAENEIKPPALGVSWDGTGYGIDGTVWGGEFLSIGDNSFDRFGHFGTFRLPGGEKAIVEPRRAALGLLYEIYGDTLFDMKNLLPIAAFKETELRAINKMLESGINCPTTSSAGRLFDAVASIVGIRQMTRFEGQAAMELEFALRGQSNDDTYPFEIIDQGGMRIFDWRPMIRRIVNDVTSLRSPDISLRFHNALASAIVEMAKLAGKANVILSGGCFQNKYLTERAVEKLTVAGFHPYWHQRIPPNDGGIALGQIMAAGADES